MYALSASTLIRQIFPDFCTGTTQTFDEANKKYSIMYKLKLLLIFKKISKLSPFYARNMRRTEKRTFMLILGLKPLSLNSDQHQISPCNINAFQPLCS